ncbi:MAG TPA: heterodisulfide reductase [Spirochaetales bacterium]|nr:heterodisulfide reductase [Spirochaetales bacterium]
MDDKNDKPLLVSKLDLSFREEIASQPGGENVKRCFACGTCAAGCPITDIDEKYNCRRIIRQILFGMREEVLSSPRIWLCLVCYRCYARCPQKVNFTDIMRILRYAAIKGHHVSAEMLSRVTELDRFSQEVRHDFIDHIFKPDKEIAEKIKLKIEEKLSV